MAAPTIVQHKSGFANNVLSMSVSFTSNVTAGNMIIAFMSAAATGTTFNTPTMTGETVEGMFAAATYILPALIGRDAETGEELFRAAGLQAEAVLVIFVRQDVHPRWHGVTHGTRSMRKNIRGTAGKLVKLPLVVVGTIGLPTRNQLVKFVVPCTS